MLFCRIRAEAVIVSVVACCPAFELLKGLRFFFFFSCSCSVRRQSLLDSISVALRDNELQAKAEERRKKREAQEKKR